MLAWRRVHSPVPVSEAQPESFNATDERRIHSARLKQKCQPIQIPSPVRKRTSGCRQPATVSWRSCFPLRLVVGWLIGAALDRWLHTTWLYLAGILLGIAAGFIELIRAAMRDTK
jgi:F0F1-type ATP synthase assembly protein I